MMQMVVNQFKRDMNKVGTPNNSEIPEVVINDPNQQIDQQQQQQQYIRSPPEVTQRI